MSTQHAPFCKCSDPNCPAVAMMRKISAMPTNGDIWSIETVAGFTMATTAAVKNRFDVVQFICCQMVNRDMTEEQMRPEFERVLKGQDLYGNTVMLWPDAGTSCSTDQFRRVQRYSQSAPPRRSRAGLATRLLVYCQSACSRSLSHYPGPSAASHGTAQSLCSRPQSRAVERWWGVHSVESSLNF